MLARKRYVIEWMLRGAAVTALSLSCSSLRVAADDLVVPFDAVQRSLVLIETAGKTGYCFGAGFVIDSSSEGSTILTAAHVLTECNSPAILPEGAAVPKTLDGVSVYLPPNVKPLGSNIAVPLTDIDTNLDLAIIHVPSPNLPVTCLKAGPPRPGAALGLAAFSVRTPTGSPNIEGPFSSFVNATYPVVRAGMVGGSNKAGTEYFAPVEYGFSGGPIFEEKTGLAFAVTQKAIQIQYRISTATLVSISGDAFARFIAEHAENIQLVPEPDRESKSIHGGVFPDISRTGRLVLLQEGPDYPDLLKDDKYRAFGMDKLLRDALIEELQLSDLIEIDHRKLFPTVGGLIGAFLNNDFYHRTCDTNHAVGFLELHRSLSRNRGGVFINYELSFSNCWGDVFKHAVIPTLTLGNEKRHNFSSSAVESESKQIIRLALVPDEKERSVLRNFSQYGLPLADGERRIFMILGHAPDGSTIVENIGEGGAASLGDLRVGSKILSFDGVSAEQLQPMTGTELFALVSDAEKTGNKINIKLISGKTVGFRGLNVCGYLSSESSGARDDLNARKALRMLFGLK